MHITRAKITNFKSLKSVDISFNDKTNIIVGDNESGKSTLLEAILLALSGQISGRSIMYDLHPYLFNQDAVSAFIEAIRGGGEIGPPFFEIELYLSDIDDLARLKGTNNSSSEDVPGITLRVELSDSFSDEYAKYIEDRDRISTLPVEYYRVAWRDFANHDLSPRSRPLRSALIDTGDLRHSAGPNRYIIDTLSDHLEDADRAQLSLSYRRMRESFENDESIQEINRKLAAKKGDLSEKTISISLDSTAKGSWEAGIITSLDSIPFPFVGKGEQSIVKIQLAMDAASDVQILLIEEPENHLTHTNLNKLIDKIRVRSEGKQVFISTHSNFVLNKLDIGNVFLFKGNNAITLPHLNADTRDYFRKLPGHDTLRLVLSSKAVLVEGPSDELVVQKSYRQIHGKLPIEDGVDVISVRSLAFKRFLEISQMLEIETHVITDNDGDLEGLRAKYHEFFDVEGISIHFDDDETCNTLENVLVRDNDLEFLNEIFGRTGTLGELLHYMKANKTESALKLFDTEREIAVPGYIRDAIT